MAISDTLNGGMAQYQFSNSELVQIKVLMQFARDEALKLNSESTAAESANGHIQTINSILAARNSRG